MSAASPTVQRNGKQVKNPHHTGLTPIVVHRLKFYGDADRLRFAMEFQEKERKVKQPKPDVYGRTIKAMCDKFGIAESTAHKDMGGLRAYRQAKFHADLPTIAGRLYEDLQRLSAKAEAGKEWTAAVMAQREIAKLTGAYAPVKLDVDVQHTVHEGPTVQQQLRAMLVVLSPEARAGLELALSEMERAKSEGRFQLTAGDDDECDEPPADDGDSSDEDVEDAELDDPK